MRLLSLIACLAACAQSPSQQGVGADSLAAVFPGAEWTRVVPESVGIEPARAAALVDAVRSGRYGSMQAIVVVRHGRVAIEDYPSWSASATHTLQSVTKSITSLLVGMAVNDGKIRIDDPVLGYFTRYPAIANRDARKEALTVKQLLTMRTSMDFYEQPYPGSPLDQLNRSTGDWVKFVLDRPMTGEPGTEWAYNSGAAILLGGLVREVTGSNLDLYARERLFAPIGITSDQWFKSPFDGLPHAGGGLSLTPLDLARIGLLVLHRGKWRDTQVVPASWIAAAMQPATRGAPVFFSNYGVGYGYLWWLFPSQRGGSDVGVWAASGAQGQWLFIVPSQDLVVAIAGGGDNRALDLLYDRLLSLTTR